MPEPVRVEISARTDRGLKRKTNEDAYLVFRTGRFLQRVQSSVDESELESRYDVAGHIMAVADGMGGAAEAARAIEPLCILWCIPGFVRNDWRHAFKLLR